MFSWIVVFAYFGVSFSAAPVQFERTIEIVLFSLQHVREILMGDVVTLGDLSSVCKERAAIVPIGCLGSRHESQSGNDRTRGHNPRSHGLTTCATWEYSMRP